MATTTPPQPRQHGPRYDQDPKQVGQTSYRTLGRCAIWALDALEGRLMLAAGDLEWVRQFGAGVGSNDLIQSVTAAGAIYVAGSTFGTLEGQTSAGNYDAFVRKYDAGGSELWTRQFGSSANDQAYAVTVDGAGSVYVVGQTAGALGGANGGGWDGFIRKYDVDGKVLWTRQFGAWADDQATSAAVDSAGNLYVVGSVSGDAFIHKYNADGTVAWTRRFGTFAADYAIGVAVDNAGGIYVAGTTFGSMGGPSSGSDDAFLRKYDPTGGVVWTRQFGSPTSDQAVGVAVDRTGGVYVAGSTYGALSGQASAGSYDAFLRKYDAAGIELWTRQLGTSEVDLAGGVAVDDADGVYLAGHTYGQLSGQTSAGSYDTFARKYDSDGNEQWTQQVGSSGMDLAAGVVADGSGGVYLAGQTDGALAARSTTGDPDAFLVKLSDRTGPTVLTPIADGRTLSASEGTQLTAIVVSSFTSSSPTSIPGDFAATITWGDGSITVGLVTSNGQGGFDVLGSHTYDDNGLYAVAVQITDNVGLGSVSASATVDVANAAPTPLISPAPAANVEGSAINLTGSASDPSAADTASALQLEWSVMKDANLFATGTGSAIAFTPDDDGTYVVSLTATDKDGGKDTSSQSIAVSNLAPTVTLTAPAPGTVTVVGAPVSFAASFTDPGLADTYTAVWTFTSDQQTITTAPQTVVNGLASLTGTFTQPGVYRMSLTITDDDQGAGTAMALGMQDAYIVVYDRSAGSLSGRGWATAPAGAYATDSSLLTKASFAFTKPSKKAATATVFQFSVGTLSLQSTASDWLAVAGNTTYYQGSGTIDGQGDYGFLLTYRNGAPTGEADTLRLKIWDKSTGLVIYDTQPGASDDAIPTTVVSGGNLTVHKA